MDRSGRDGKQGSGGRLTTDCQAGLGPVTLAGAGNRHRSDFISCSESRLVDRHYGRIGRSPGCHSGDIPGAAVPTARGAVSTEGSGGGELLSRSRENGGVNRADCDSDDIVGSSKELTAKTAREREEQQDIQGNL